MSEFVSTLGLGSHSDTEKSDMESDELPSIFVFYVLCICLYVMNPYNADLSPPTRAQSVCLRDMLSKCHLSLTPDISHLCLRLCATICLCYHKLVDCTVLLFFFLVIACHTVFSLVFFVLFSQVFRDVRDPVTSDQSGQEIIINHFGTTFSSLTLD